MNQAGQLKIRKGNSWSLMTTLVMESLVSL